MYKALDRYIDHLVAVRNASPYTIRNYGHEIAEALDHFRAHGVRTFEDLDRGHLRRYLATLHEQGYARSSIARRVAELRAFGQFLQREGTVAASPFAALLSPKLPVRLPRVLSEDQVVALLAAPPAETPIGLRDRAILETLYGAGLRVSELQGLDVADYDAAGRTLRVTGKGDKERVALLGRHGAAALATYLTAARPQLARSAAQPALFLNADGGSRLTARSVQRCVAHHARAAGLSQAADAPRAAALLRHASHERRRRSAGGAGAPGPRVGEHHPGVYPCQHGPATAGAGCPAAGAADVTSSAGRQAGRRGGIRRFGIGAAVGRGAGGCGAAAAKSRRRRQRG